ncbi:hypothetical protein HC031_20070 [Planosporangium thailandense]|uniref:Uncharacterized protein n=1 Tax=Planosporangium thailandense TaxID=765197 RepID=A0ABX0Y350_9ACTN|nr:hypothetical protein [Planosporangium thailandense]NJC71995.1 hypothetical protein [Planosporangium thailandense]
MATTRVHFGVAVDGPSPATPRLPRTLKIALVDDGGRLLDLRDADDDVYGYGQLLALLARHPASSGIAADADGVVTDLLCTAGRHLSITDLRSAEGYADHFAASQALSGHTAGSADRRAVGMAHALRTGILVPVAQPVPQHLRGLEHVLAAHTAALDGRDGAATALYEILRQLYPAVLRAFPDPAAELPLAILATLPDLQLLLEPSGEADRWVRRLVGDLSESSGADPTTVARAVATLEEALRRTPQHIGPARLARSPARAVHQVAAAVRAHDDAVSALLGTLAARLPDPLTARQPDPLTDRLPDPLTDRQREARVQPPWQADDLLLADPPVLRLVDPLPSDPVADDKSDDELPIFQQARSAWFARSPQNGADTPGGWTGPADEGWQAANRAAQPLLAGSTTVGLPRRAPMSNLVPGSAAPGENTAAIRRDAASVATHAASYFRGSRRDVTGDRAYGDGIADSGPVRNRTWDRPDGF